VSFTPTHWDRPPQQPWPLSDLGQLFIANRGVVQNLALKGTFSGRPFTDSNARGASGTTVGMRLNSAVTDSSSVIANADAGWLNGATSATVVAHFLPRFVPSGTTEERLFTRWASGNTQFIFQMRGPEIGLAIRAPSLGNIQARQSSGAALTAGRVYTVVATWSADNGGTHKFWLNGRRITTASDGTWLVQGGASSIGTVTSNLTFGCDPGGGSKATDALLSGMAIMPLDIGEARAEALSRNFWQLYQPIQRNLWPVEVLGGGISGTLTQTLGDATSTATGTLAISGTTSQTLGNATSTATGTLRIAGTATQTLGNVTSAATGALLIQGATTATLAAATLAAAGELQAAGTGTLTATLADVTSSATGALAIQGTATATLAAVTSAATGALQIQGTTTATLAAVTLAAEGTGQQVTVGELAATLANVTASATGKLLIAGTTTATLADVTAAATGRVDIAATLGVTLQDAILVSTGTGLEPIAGTLTATLADATLTATATIADFVAARISAPPIGHGPTLARRTPATLRRRAPNLSTRTR
jgi:hypothetical protein